jgi:hypothetical protein
MKTLSLSLFLTLSLYLTDRNRRLGMLYRGGYLTTMTTTANASANDNKQSTRLTRENGREEGRKERRKGGVWLSTTTLAHAGIVNGQR